MNVSISYVCNIMDMCNLVKQVFRYSFLIGSAYKHNIVLHLIINTRIVSIGMLAAPFIPTYVQRQFAVIDKEFKR